MTTANRIAILHHNLMEKGGAEGVSMNVLEALQYDYDLTILTLTDPDFEELNQYYNTSVDRTKIDIDRLGDHFQLLYDNSERFHLLKQALLSRLASRATPPGRFDLIFNTYNEYTLPGNSLQYVHMPQFRRWVNGEGAEPSSVFFQKYDEICKTIEGFDREAIRSSRFLANSEWTAGVTEDLYGVRPTVVYPPIDLDGFFETPWSEKESGFVMLGRVLPKKNVLRTVDIIHRVRECGHDVHLHVVGPTTDGEYSERVRTEAAKHDFVRIEGEVSRDRLIELACTHRYGIHGTDHEHFGMAVAELAGGGTIPFVPNGGGQREIVRERDEFLYNSVEEAVENIDRVLSDEDLQHELRDVVGNIEQRFGREKFKQQIREHVQEEF